jgi:hypothetical protein
LPLPRVWLEHPHLHLPHPRVWLGLPRIWLVHLNTRMWQMKMRMRCLKRGKRRKSRLLPRPRRYWGGSGAGGTGRELSQLAADGRVDGALDNQTRSLCRSGGGLGTIRAPGPGGDGWRAGFTCLFQNNSSAPESFIAGLRRRR